MAAIASQVGRDVKGDGSSQETIQKLPGILVIERNTSAGNKLLRTGRERCNITHDNSAKEILRAYSPYDKFLRHAVHTFPPDQVRAFFHDRGLNTYVEPDGCVFPATDRASDVKRILMEECERLQIQFVCGRRVEGIDKTEDGFIIKAGDDTYSCQSVVIATGGLSWPGTGSTGDGYVLAQSLGHTIVQTRAALIPLVTQEIWPGSLQGIGVPNVRFTARHNGKAYSACGPLMFTGSGLGGPAVMDLSRQLADVIAQAEHPIEMVMDFMASTTYEDLQGQLIQLCQQQPKKQLVTVLSHWLPKSLVQFLCQQADCLDTEAGQLSKSKRKALLQAVKEQVVHITSTRPIGEAIITRGGVCLDEIDPKTMQSKLCRGLYFAGEVIDADGPCGGYNLQIAWSTGFLAGSMIRGR
jgi:predicted Rossmann fold flavoprotein